VSAPSTDIVARGWGQRPSPLKFWAVKKLSENLLAILSENFLSKNAKFGTENPAVLHYEKTEK